MHISKSCGFGLIMPFISNMTQQMVLIDLDLYWPFVRVNSNIYLKENVWGERFVHVHIVSWKDKGCALCCHLPVFVVGLWVRCSSHRPCFSMGRSLSSDRKNTILSGKWEGTEGEKVSLGTSGRQTPSGRHTPIALHPTQTTLACIDHLFFFTPPTGFCSLIDWFGLLSIQTSLPFLVVRSRLAL